jgi:hypothetical protein
MLNYLLARLGLVRLKDVRDQLNFARTVGKRLDEHREVVEQIEQQTPLFRDAWWHAGHMATQDDYLMRLYYLVHGTWPEDAPTTPTGRQVSGEMVRARPSILGPCRLPEYESKNGWENRKTPCVQRSQNSKQPIGS